MAITNNGVFMNIPGGNDDDMPFGLAESEEETERREREMFNELPYKCKSRIQDAFEGGGVLKLKDARALVRNPERIHKECTDGNIWFFLDRDGRSLKSVVCMNPVLFALYIGEYKAADRLLSIKNFNDPDKYDPVEFLLVRKPNAGGSYRLINHNRYERQDFYKFGLGQYLFGSGDEKALPVIYKFLKCHHKGACAGWLLPPGKDDYHVLTEDDEPRKEGGTALEFIPSERIYGPFLKLLEYISGNDKDLLRHMVTKQIFTELILYYFKQNIPLSQNSNLQVLNKIYRSSDLELTPGDMWPEIYFRVSINDLYEYGYEEHVDDLGKYYEMVTGKLLVFNAKDTGFAPDACGIDFLFLEVLIRASHHAIYVSGGKKAHKAAFNLEELIEDCGEELIKTALKKDFITVKNCDGLIKKARSVNRCSLIPLLLLKKYGEWPPFEENEGVCDGKKKIQKRADSC